MLDKTMAAFSEITERPVLLAMLVVALSTAPGDEEDEGIDEEEASVAEPSLDTIAASFATCTSSSRKFASCAQAVAETCRRQCKPCSAVSRWAATHAVRRSRGGAARTVALSAIAEKVVDEDCDAQHTGTHSACEDEDTGFASSCTSGHDDGRDCRKPVE